MVGLSVIPTAESWAVDWTDLKAAKSGFSLESVSVQLGVESVDLWVHKKAATMAETTDYRSVGRMGGSLDDE